MEGYLETQIPKRLDHSYSHARENRAWSALLVVHSRTTLLFRVIYTMLQACSDPLIQRNMPDCLVAVHSILVNNSFACVVFHIVAYCKTLT